MEALPVTLEKWRNGGWLPEAPLKSLLVANHKPTGQELTALGMQMLTACIRWETHCREWQSPSLHLFFLLFILILSYLSALTLEDLPSWDAAVLHHSGLLGKSLRGDRSRMGSAGGASMLRKHFALHCLLLK